MPSYGQRARKEFRKLEKKGKDDWMVVWVQMLLKSIFSALVLLEASKFLQMLKTLRMI